MTDWREVYPLPWEVERESVFIIAGDGTSVVHPYYPSAAPEQVEMLQAICNAMNNQGTLMEVDTREQRRFELFRAALQNLLGTCPTTGVAVGFAIHAANAALEAYEAQDKPE